MSERNQKKKHEESRTTNVRSDPARLLHWTWTKQNDYQQASRAGDERLTNSLGNVCLTVAPLADIAVMMHQILISKPVLVLWWLF